jgi:hypothetical protein
MSNADQLVNFGMENLTKIVEVFLYPHVPTPTHTRRACQKEVGDTTDILILLWYSFLFF